MSDEAVEKNAQLVEKLIKAQPHQHEPDDGSPVFLRRQPLIDMFDKIGTQFYTAPASSREDYHGCYPGGLCDHSLRVTKNLTALADAWAPGRFQKERLIFVGLLHDFGKVGDVNTPLYVPNPSEWHRKKGMLFEMNKDLPYMPTCDRTMYLLQKFGINVDVEEYVAIRISDGPYEKSNEKYNMKEPDLAVLLHMADRWACSQEKALDKA